MTLKIYNSVAWLFHFFLLVLTLVALSSLIHNLFSLDR